MYHERKTHGLRWAAAALLLGLCLLACVQLAQRAARDAAAQSRASVRQAVLRCAVQCYAVEGVYPPTLQYLEDSYGLIVNHDRYIVTYEAFASNLPPTVTVLTK